MGISEALEHIRAYLPAPFGHRKLPGAVETVPTAVQLVANIRTVGVTPPWPSGKILVTHPLGNGLLDVLVAFLGYPGSVASRWARDADEVTPVQS